MTSVPIDESTASFWPRPSNAPYQVDDPLLKAMSTEWHGPEEGEESDGDSEAWEDDGPFDDVDGPLCLREEWFYLDRTEQPGSLGSEIEAYTAATKSEDMDKQLQALMRMRRIVESTQSEVRGGTTLNISDMYRATEIISGVKLLDDVGPDSSLTPTGELLVVIRDKQERLVGRYVVNAMMQAASTRSL